MRDRPSPGSLDDEAEAGTASPPRVPRRAVLKVMGTLGAVAAALPLALSPLRSLFRWAPTAFADTGLAEAHLATVLALADVMVPSAYAGPSLDDHARARSVVRDSLERLVAGNSGTIADLRAAAALLDARSGAGHGQPFASLTLADRRALVEGLLEPFRRRDALRRVYYRVAPAGRQVRRLWHGACVPILAGFYASALGWEVVGYEGPPGQCSNLVDYTLPVKRIPS
jgi:hypothetical protein